MRARRSGALLLAAALTLLLAAVANACSVQELAARLPDASLFVELLSALGDEATAAAAQRRLLAQAAPGFRACPRIAAPVCARDGREFVNDCYASNAGAQVACDGPCPCLTGAAAAAAGVITEGPIDPVMGPCPRTFIPVCGKNGKTYSNVCVAGGAARVACEGRCPCKAGMEAASIEDASSLVAEPRGVAAGEMGRVDEGSARVAAAAVACPAIFMPVCGADGTSYSSPCQANAAGTKVACGGACPCGGDTGSAPSSACIDIVDPVCGTDAVNYTNTCYAQAAGVQVRCLGPCPCTDPLVELERGAGGVVLVPTDDALLAALEASLNGTASASAGDWLAEPAVLRQLLARHVALADHQRSKQVPLPSLDGTRAVTEAGQRIDLYAASKQAPGRVQTTGEAADSFDVLATAAQPGCDVTLLQIGGVLEGPQPGQ